MWILVIQNLVTDEVDLCDLGENEEDARFLAKAYIQTLEGQRRDFDVLRYAVTKPRPIVAYVPA